jgi:two-component system, cell cycle sensor histidine kinase and response regulator CckA
MKLAETWGAAGLVSMLPGVLRSHASLRLRTKFLLSLALITSGLTCATLLAVRHAVQAQMQREIEEGAHSAILTFQVVQHQHQIELSHKAELLASLATMRDGHPTAIQEASQDPWQSDDRELFALADTSGKIVALRTTDPDLPVAKAEEMLRRTPEGKNATAWWFTGNGLYQVVQQPFYEYHPLKNSPLGTVIVGRLLDTRAAADLQRISSSHVILRYGGEIVVSTFSAFKEHDLAQQIQGRAVPEQIHIDNERFLASTFELTPNSRPGVSLTVLKSYGDAEAFLERLNRLLFGLGVMATLAGAGLVFIISDTFTRPLASLFGAVRAVEDGNFDYPVEAQGGDEVAQVTRAFDRMRGTLQRNDAQKQQLEAQLRQAQKMDAMGRLAGGVAHDFNNLLTVIKGNSGLQLERLQPGDPLLATARQIESAADRAASLTRQLLAFCRMQVLQPQILDLNALVSEMCKLLRRLVREDIAFTFHAGESLGRVKADPGQIEQVIMNLVVNAGDAMPVGGCLTIETRNVAVDEQFARSRPPILPGRYVLLAVTDTGHGMDAHTRARIFEPFFTTKEQGKGTGLGLATVYGVVKQSGGCIWVESDPGKGARFEVYLPRFDEAATPAPHVEIAAAPVRLRKTVLIVEDEEAVRELASGFLESAGYAVLAARDGADALAIVQRSEEPIHVLVTDVVMPKMRGPELANQLKSLLTGLRVIYMSGYLEYNRDNEDFLEEGFFLQKPFSRDSLVRKVSEALRPDLSARSIEHTVLG